METLALFRSFSCQGWGGLLGAAALLCVLWMPDGVLAAAKPSTGKAGLSQKTFVTPNQGPWNIEAGRLTYDQKRKTYLAEGNVRIFSDDRSLTADWAELNTETDQAELRGHVHVQYGKDWLEGEHVIWNIRDETGWVEGGIVYFSENHFYVQGRHIAKVGPTEYELEDGFVTSCDPVNSDWKIRYGSLNVKLNGLSWAKQTSFLVRGVPILYAPIVGLPVETERQSGLLIPWGGYSDLNGFEGEVPYYWAIRKDMDLTLYGRYMTERGWMSGAEYRIANKTWGEGVWLINYLHDQADREHLAAEGYPYVTEDRFWLRSRHTFELPNEIEGRLDLDVVSDRNFLKEFDRGSSSYDYSNKTFQELFGRGILNDKTILARESSLYLDKRYESVLISMDTRYWEQLDKAFDETTLERLPAFGFQVIPSWIDRSPFYYTLNSSLVNYWRPEGDRGERLDVYPRLGYPLHWKSYLDVEPSVGMRSTSYAVDWEEDAHGQWQGRLLSDVQLDMSSRMNRVYSFDMGDVVAVQHAIRPEIVYEYIPKIYQGDLPHFDLLDEEKARHDIRYGFSTFLTTKAVHTASNGVVTTDYQEVARLEVTQPYNIEAPPQDIDDPRLGTDWEPEKGFGGVDLRLDLIPKRFITLSYDTEIAPDGNGVNQDDVYMILDSGKGQMLRLDYQYRENSEIDEVITETNLKVLPSIYLSTYHDYSLEKSELFAYGYGVRYQSGCWAFGVAYEREAEDHRIAFSINLLGLGAYGTGIGHVSGNVSHVLPGSAFSSSPMSGS